MHAFKVTGKPFDGEMKAIAGCIHQIHMKDGLHQHPLCATRAVLESVTDEDINATDLCAIPKAPADDPLYPTSKIARRELKKLEVNSNYRRTQDMQLQRRVFCLVTQRLESINLDNLSEVEKLLDDMKDMCRLMPDGSEAMLETIRRRMNSAIQRLSSHEVLTKAIESVQVKTARDLQLQNRISCFVSQRLESINLDDLSEVEKLLDDIQDMCRLKPDGSEAKLETIRRRMSTAIGRLSSNVVLTNAIESLQVKGAGRDLQLQNSISCRDMQLQNRISCFVSQRLESINLDNAIEVEKLLDDMKDMCRLMPDGSETTSTTLRHRMNSAIQRLSSHEVLTKAIESVRNRKRCSKQLKKKYGKEWQFEVLRLQTFGQDDIQIASQSKAVVDAFLRKHENIQLNDDNIIQISQLQAHAIVTTQHQQLDSESKEQRINLQAEWLVATYHYAQVCGKTPTLECILCGR